MSKQGELGTSHTEIHTSQWTGSVIQVTRMGLGFGANCGVPERLGAGWQSSPGASGNRAEPPTTELGSSKSPGISHARVGIRCSLPVAAGAGSQQISRQQLCHLQIPRQAHAHMCHIPPGPSGETQQPMLAPQFENLKVAGSPWLTAGASPPSLPLCGRSGPQNHSPLRQAFSWYSLRAQRCQSRKPLAPTNNI